MKKISTLALASLLLTNIACAQAPVFTSIGTSGLNVFAGVKLEQKGMEPETYILEVSKDKFASKKSRCLLNLSTVKWLHFFQRKIISWWFSAKELLSKAISLSFTAIIRQERMEKASRIRLCLICQAQCES